MNRIFKVIWSKTKGCYVVVSEIAKNQSKSGKRRARDLALAAIVGVGVAMSTGVGVAHAGENDPATEGWVTNQIQAIKNGEIAGLQSQITAVRQIAESNNGGGSVNLDNYATKAYVTDAIAAVTGTDLSDYATVDYVDQSIAALTAEDGAITAAQAAATTADGKAVAAQTTANEAKTAAATADGKAEAVKTAAENNAKDIADLKADKADKTALAEVKATADANATAITGLQNDKADKTALQAEVTRAQGAEAQALADAKTYTDGKLGAAAGGMYISAANTVAQNMTAIDTKLQDVQKITYDGSYADSEGGFTGGATKVNGPVVIDGTHDFTFNTETGRIKGLSNVDWTTDPALDGSDVAATQGQLYDIASKGFQVKANNGTFNAPLATQISILGDGTNITTASEEGSRKLTINLTDTPVFTEVTTTPVNGTMTRMDGTGFYVEQTSGTGSATAVSLTAAGLNNGRNQLKNIADATDYTDAVTYKQLIADRIKLQGAGDAVVTFAPIIKEGTDIIEGTMYTITVTDKDTKPAGDGLTTSVSNGNVVSVRLPKDAQGNYNGSIIATEEDGLTLNPVLTLNGGAQSITFDAPKGHISGLTNITWYERNENDTYSPNKVATEGQLNDIVTEGWDLGADNATKTLQLNKAANIIGGTNIKTSIADPDANGNLNLTVSTKPDVVFNTVSVKNLDPDTGLPVTGTNTVSIDSQHVSGLQNITFFNNSPLNTVVTNNDTSATYLAPGNLPQNVATSGKAATEAQLYDVVTGLDKADRYITNITTATSSTGTKVTIDQNNAQKWEFTIPPTTGGGGGTGGLAPRPDDQNHPIPNDGNADNWYIKDGDAIYENTTLATMDSTRPGKKSSVEAITGTIDGMSDSTRDQVTAAISSMKDATTGEVTYGHNYTIMDTAGNSINLSDLASASVLDTVHNVVLNHDGRIRIVEDGFALKAGTQVSHTGDVKPGETLEFTGNVSSTNANIKIDYDNEADKIDISVVDNPKFTSVEVAAEGGKKVIIDSNGVSFDGNYYIGPNGLDGNGKVISRVAPGEISSTSLDAVNGSQLYPVKKAVEDGFTVNGYKINLIGEGTEGFSINAGKNIEVTTNGSATTIATSMTPEFTAVTVGTVMKDAEGNVISNPITINAANQGAIRNLKNTTWTLNQSVPYSGQAATEDQLAIVDSGLTNLGMNFVGDTEGASVHKNLGQTLKIVGGASTVTEEDNIRVDYVDNNGQPYLKVGLAKNVNLTPDGSIVANDAKFDADGLTVTNGANSGADQQIANYNEGGMTIIRPKNDSRHDLAFTDEYISAGDNVITNVGSGLTLAPGQTTPNLNNAATVGDVMKLATTVEGDKNITATMKDDPQVPGKKIAEVTLNPIVKLGPNGSEKVTLNGNTGEAKFGNVSVNTNSTITGLSNTTYAVQNKPNKGSNQAATQGQLYDIVDKTAGGWGLAADSGTVTKQDIGKTLSIKGADVNGNKNITTTTTANGVEIALKNRVELGANDAVVLDGEQGMITAGTGATSVVIDGTKNQIVTGDLVIKGTAGAATINGLSNKTWDPAKFVTGQAATEDQLKAMSDADTDYQLIANPDGGNYKVNADGEVTLKVQDNKHPDADLQDVIIEDIASKTKLDAVEKDYVKNVTKNQTGDTITITQNVNGTEQKVEFSNTNDHIAAGTYTVGEDGKVILNMVDVNGDPLDSTVVIDGIASSADLDNATIAYKANSGNALTVKLSDGFDFTNGKNTVATVAADGVVTFDLADDIQIGQKGENGQDGIIGVNGKDGASVVINGKDGSIGLTGPKGEDGKDGASATLSVKDGAPGVDGKDGITRIEYKDAEGDSHEVATLDDGLKFTADDGEVIEKKLNETLAITGGDNITTSVSADGAIQVSLDSDIDLGDDGSITIGDTVINNEGMTVGDTTITGDTINIGGEDGTTITDDTITTTTVETTNVVINGTDLTIEEGSATVNGDVIKRITYEGQEVATLEDGMKYSGDRGDQLKMQLNENVNIIGGVAQDAVLTTGNIGVVSDGKGTLTVQLNKDIDLTDEGSITIGGTNIKDGEATFGDGRTKVVIDGNEGTVTVGDKINLDGVEGNGNIGDIVFNQDDIYKTSITGMSNTTWDPNKVQVDRVATEGQLKDIADIAAAHNTVTTADPNNITVKETPNANGGTNYELNLGTDLNIGGPGKDGAPGKDGSIGVQGATGETGVSLNGKDGSIGIDGKDGASATITVVGGEKGADGAPGVDGKNITRIEYQDATGTHDVATLDDGMKFTADDGKVIEKKLNETLAIVGDDNITTTVTDDGAIQVTLNKDIAVDSIDVADGTFKANEDGVSISVEDTNVVVTDGLIGMAVGEDTSMSMNDSNINMTVGDTSIDVDADGVTFNNGDSMTIINGDNIKAGDITIDGGEGTIGGLTNTTFDPDNYVSGQAATEDQLKQVHDLAKAHNTVTTADPNNITIKETENEDGGTNYELNLGDSLNIGGPKDGKDGVDGQIAVNGADGKDSVVINGKDGISIKGEDGSIGLNGKDGLSIKGADGKDGVNAYVDGDGVGHIGLNGKDGANADITVVKGDPGVKGEDGETIDRIVYGDHTVATLDDGMKYSGDVGDQLKMQLNENVNIIGGVDDEAALTDNNIGVVSNGRDTLTIKLNKELTGLEKVQVGDVVIDGKENTIQVGENTKIGDGTVETKEVTAENVIVKETIKVGDKTEITGDTVTTETVKTGDTTINNNGMTIKDGPTVNKDKVDVAGNKIENVAPGILSKDSMDAVNGSQLYQTNQTINKLGNRVNRVGARSAALAALHPMDFDPDDKLTFAAGYGNYKGENAAAIGAFYRPDEKVMFSLAGTVSNDDNMINAGVSFSLDRTPHQTNSKTAMARDILDLTAKVNLLLQENDRMKNALREATKNGGRVSIEFPDLPKDHWAYMYVQELAELGYLIGYPDGLYKGDRTLTRYEFATALYRALMNGAPVDDKMGRGMDEFKNELDNVAKAARFRVDRIAGQDDDRNKIERVRTNHEGDESIPDYRDVYGSKIAPPAKK